MDRVQSVLDGLQQAARRAVVTAGAAGVLAAGGLVIAGAFAYAIAAAVSAPTAEAQAEDEDDPARTSSRVPSA